MALGAAGVVVASAQAAKRTVRRAQVVRQATAVAEKTFTKMPASVTWREFRVFRVCLIVSMATECCVMFFGEGADDTCLER